ncbi:MAG: carboxypeptidase M32 [Phycisphaerales bacterium]
MSKHATLPSSYVELCSALREAATIGSVAALVGWDQETYMPPAGSAFRSEQQATLASLTHERKTNPRIADLLAACEGDGGVMGDAARAANIREIRRDYSLATKLPKELVSELARVGSLAQDAWKKARADDDFKGFAPWLEKMFELQRQKAKCYGVPKGGELYDALLDEYEPGATAVQVTATFNPLRDRLTDLIMRVESAKKTVKVPTACLKAKIPADKQHALGLMVMKSIGFDLDAGRLDTTTHPFCSGMAPGDTRLTTRYQDQAFTDALYSTMHEAGHGLYEQGLPKLPPATSNNGTIDLFGTPLADAISLGMHESQSRMWENFVGRSLPFWKWLLPKSTKIVGTALSKYKPETLYKAVNTVTPSLIRVESDEATYNMHVMIRFEIERALVAGDLKVADLPATWNRKYKDYLGVKVPDDRRGCLQDVHWSFGLVGYFPTYTLGNLYAAQFWEKINADIPDLAKQHAKGQFGPLLEWLRTNIHRHGRRYHAAELCERVTGKSLTSEALLRHLEGRAADVYRL